MRFTDSPYETMMKQIPSGKRAAETPPALPPGHPCKGCSYGKSGPCMGVCYRELTRKGGKKCSL